MAWLRSLDGRFAGALTERPGPPWAVHNVVTFLAALHQLPLSTSWESWDTTLSSLLERVAGWTEKTSLRP